MRFPQRSASKFGPTLRPESLALHNSGVASRITSRNLVNVIFLGSIVVVVTLSVELLMDTFNNLHPMPLGSEVTVGFPPEACIVLGRKKRPSQAHHSSPADGLLLFKLVLSPSRVGFLRNTDVRTEGGDMRVLRALGVDGLARLSASFREERHFALWGLPALKCGARMTAEIDSIVPAVNITCSSYWVYGFGFPLWWSEPDVGEPSQGRDVTADSLPVMAHSPVKNRSAWAYQQARRRGRGWSSGDPRIAWMFSVV